MRTFFAGFICCSLFMASCSKKSGTAMSCTYDSCASPAPDSEIQRVQQYVTASKLDGVVKHCSGLFYQVVAAGAGTQPTACSSVTVKYTGTFTDGSVFDQSSTPVPLSLLRVIEGWKKGLPLIKKGGKIKLIIPPSLAYGASGYGSIPGNAILIFDIELVDVS